MDDLHIYALHRYYLQANQMRVHFDSYLKLNKGSVTWESPERLYLSLYMGLWYGSLYVVVEGWKELGLADLVVDELLTSPHVELLNRYRNGVFHYQKAYHDGRFLDFMKQPDTPGWVRSLHAEFGRYFLEWFAARRKD
jgi:hypothetical protein